MVVRVSGGVTRRRHSTKGSKITMRKYLKILSRYSSLINAAIVCSLAEPPFPVLGNDCWGIRRNLTLFLSFSPNNLLWWRNVYEIRWLILSMGTLGCVRTNQHNMNVGCRVLTMQCLFYISLSIYIYRYISQRDSVPPVKVLDGLQTEQKRQPQNLTIQASYGTENNNSTKNVGQINANNYFLGGG